MTDIDGLPPTQYLILETLGARHRLGETWWPFPNSCHRAATRLWTAGLVTIQGGQTPGTFRAALTDTGRAAVLASSYHPPAPRQRMQPIPGAGYQTDDEMRRIMADPAPVVIHAPAYTVAVPLDTTQPWPVTWCDQCHAWKPADVSPPLGSHTHYPEDLTIQANLAALGRALDCQPEPPPDTSWLTFEPLHPPLLTAPPLAVLARDALLTIGRTLLRRRH